LAVVALVAKTLNPNKWIGLQLCHSNDSSFLGK
jgi:hypothetical protein